MSWFEALGEHVHFALLLPDVGKATELPEASLEAVHRQLLPNIDAWRYVLEVFPSFQLFDITNSLDTEPLIDIVHREEWFFR